MLPEPGDVVCAGLDMGLRSDSSALVIVHRRGEMLSVASLIEMRPTAGIPLKPSEVVRTFAREMVRHGCTYAVGDSHYAESVREYLTESDLALAAGPTPPAEAYMRTRSLLREGRVRLPRHDRLLQQMREVHGKPTSGGGMSIVHPRWATGGHGDLVAALVLALWQVSGNEVMPPKPELGTEEWIAVSREARQKRHVEKLSQEKDRGRGAYWRKSS